MPVEELNWYFMLVALLTVVLTPVIWFVSGKQIIIDNTSFIYTNGFTKSIIEFDKIINSDIRLVVKKYPDTVWELLLHDNQSIAIPISYYSRKDLQVFAKTLVT